MESAVLSGQDSWCPWGLCLVWFLWFVLFIWFIWLEPISKLFEEHRDAFELHKAQEDCGVIFPPDQQAPLPLEPGKEPFDEPAALIATEGTAILGLEFAGGSMRGNQIHPVLLEVIIEPITVIRPIANEMLGLGLQHVEVETELHQRDLMMIGRMRADGEG